jgi:hypothetical protein
VLGHLHHTRRLSRGLGVSRYPVGTQATAPAAGGTWSLTDADGDTLKQATAL